MRRLGVIDIRWFMSSVYEIRDGESGRISQCLCIRNEAAIHARDGGGKGGGYFCKDMMTSKRA
eukprot:scaffold33379_cov41-Cyclotella_meneghiniana.AAC.1